jgi:rhodanese-related sulfurtransferase
MSHFNADVALEVANPSVVVGAANATIFAAAAARAHEGALSYAGAVTPREAFTLWRNGAAQIIDVRTRCEFEYVGHVPDTSLVEWKAWQCAAPNPHFIASLEAEVSLDLPILLLCRSGVRSHHGAIAATRAGFANVYNILEGFEGDPNAGGQRNLTNGWRFAGLPWRQS